MHSLLRTLLLTLVLIAVPAIAPMPALCGDAPVGRAPSAAEAPPSSLAALQERLFILEHQLHALEAELMALRKRLADLTKGASE